VERFHGRLVKTTGDGILATFDAPTRALRCAFGLMDTIRQLGLRIRAAVHTGEIEIVAEDVGGIGVHIAARVLGEASDDQVVVTRTVRELATGTDLIYDPLGTVHLRGVPGDWELFGASTPESPTTAADASASPPESHDRPLRVFMSKSLSRAVPPRRVQSHILEAVSDAGPEQCLQKLRR